MSNVFCFGGEQTALLIAAFLIFRETHSAIFVGLIIVAYNVPQVLLAGAANALSARWGAVRACCILHGAEMVSALVVAGAAFAHHLSVPVLLSWVTVLGISEGLNSPNPPLIRLEMVPPDYWLEYNGSRTQSIVIGTIGGILLSGVIYGLLGPGWVFVINAVGLVPMIVLYWMFGRTTPELTVVTDEVGTLREGWHYLRSEPGSWAALRLVILAFFLSGYVVLLPTIASGIGSRPEILSILEAGTVVGGLLVAICVKYLHRRVGWSRVRMFCSVSAGLLLGLIAMTESFFGTRSALASVLMAVAIIPVGFAILMNSTVLISGMQLATPPSAPSGDLHHPRGDPPGGGGPQSGVRRFLGRRIFGARSLWDLGPDHVGGGTLGVSSPHGPPPPSPRWHGRPSCSTAPDASWQESRRGWSPPILAGSVGGGRAADEAIGLTSTEISVSFCW